MKHAKILIRCVILILSAVCIFTLIGNCTRTLALVEGHSETLVNTFYGEDESTVEPDDEEPTTGNCADGTADHNWSGPVWTWEKTDDGYKATATWTCDKCGEIYAVTATVTKTINDDGSVTYTATAIGPDGVTEHTDKRIESAGTLTEQTTDSQDKGTTGSQTDSSSGGNAKTGDNTNLAFWLILTIASLLTLILTLVRYFMSRKAE